jgi:hypothetical protein
MIIPPYPDEAVSSWLIRASARCLIELEQGGCPPATDLDGAPDALPRLDHFPEAEALLKDLAAQAIRRRWPAAEPRDLDEFDPATRSLAKVCEACLADDVACGRDHYVRQEWRFSWRVSCSRHRTPLIDVEKAELAPVIIDGSPEWRVRLLRDYDLVMDPFLSRTDRGGGGSKMTLPAPLLSLESDIMASLTGRPFPCIWSCGCDWSRARTALFDLTDILLTRSKDNGERLIHRILVDERTPHTHIFQFSEKALNGLQASWQRLVISALATLLLDPERYDHAVDGQPWQAHAQLIRGAWAALRLRRTLGRLASQDWLCVIMAGADGPTLKTIEARLDQWPRDLRRRTKSAAAVALFV